MLTFDPSYLLEHFPKVFQRKGQFRDAFYGKLLEQTPELQPHFDRYPIAKTHMMERFMMDLVKSASTGTGIADLATSFAASHGKFHLVDRHFTACEIAMKHAFSEVSQDQSSIPSDAELNFHMFLEIVFHELRKAGQSAGEAPATLTAYARR